MNIISVSGSDNSEVSDRSSIMHETFYNAAISATPRWLSQLFPSLYLRIYLPILPCKNLLTVFFARRSAGPRGGHRLPSGFFWDLCRLRFAWAILMWFPFPKLWWVIETVALGFWRDIPKRTGYGNFVCSESMGLSQEKNPNKLPKVKTFSSVLGRNRNIESNMHSFFTCLFSHLLVLKKSKVIQKCWKVLHRH